MEHNNLIPRKTFARQTAESRGRFIVSARRLPENISVSTYLKIYYTYLRQEQIDSVFGFALDYLPLYGGRSRLRGKLLKQRHLTQLYGLGIHLSLTLSNHYFSEETYESSCRILERLHRRGNSITCVNDTLALRIRKDFPRFSITASLIKELDTLDKVEKALQIYDHVVIPMEKNDDDVFLNALPEKTRIVLFANAGCAYNCPARICYLSISRQFASQGKYQISACSKDRIKRDGMPPLFFDIEKFEGMGFRRFKLIPENLEAVAQHFSDPLSPPGSTGHSRNTPEALRSP